MGKIICLLSQILVLSGPTGSDHILFRALQGTGEGFAEELRTAGSAYFTRQLCGSNGSKAQLSMPTPVTTAQPFLLACSVTITRFPGHFFMPTLWTHTVVSTALVQATPVDPEIHLTYLSTGSLSLIMKDESRPSNINPNLVK